MVVVTNEFALIENPSNTSLHILQLLQTCGLQITHPRKQRLANPLREVWILAEFN